MASLRLFLERFNAVTLVVDGRHSPLIYDRKLAGLLHVARDDRGGVLSEKDYFSYKLKCVALNTQMAIGPDGYIEWLSDSLPAGRWNDIS